LCYDERNNKEEKMLVVSYADFFCESFPVQKRSRRFRAENPAGEKAEEAFP